MGPIEEFDLFLFDFDGLLVDTEQLHYEAYLEMLRRRKAQIDWSFAAFCRLAHGSQDGLQKAIVAQFPHFAPIWSTLYQEKKEIYFSFLGKKKVPLLPGVCELIEKITSWGKTRVIVTNSLRSHLEAIALNLPLLQKIPHWVTREDYQEPKPDSECYRLAISLYGKPGGKIIGFEDSFRGIRALSQTEALPVWVCSKEIYLAHQKKVPRAYHIPSLRSFG